MNIFIHENFPIYGIYLVNIKFGELAHNANWRTFSLGSSESVDCLYTCDYNKYWYISNMEIEAKITNPSN